MPAFIKTTIIVLSTLLLGIGVIFFTFKKTNAPEELARVVGLSSFYTDRLSLSQSDSGLSIKASEKNRVPITLLGFSLVAGTEKISIPKGTKQLSYGTVNQEEVITLSPGEEVLLTQGPSPVGVSFLENKCTGYLNEFLSFTPALSEDCPLFSPSDTGPETACRAILKTLPPCRSKITQLPQGTSAACRSFIADTANYNTCVEKHKNDPDFFNQTWRVFIPTLNIEKNTTITLLDPENKKVAEIGTTP